MCVCVFLPLMRSLSVSAAGAPSSPWSHERQRFQLAGCSLRQQPSRSLLHRYPLCSPWFADVLSGKGARWAAMPVSLPTWGFLASPLLARQGFSWEVGGLFPGGWGHAHYVVFGVLSVPGRSLGCGTRIAETRQQQPPSLHTRVKRDSFWARRLAARCPPTARVPRPRCLLVPPVPLTGEL